MSAHIFGGSGSGGYNCHLVGRGQNAAKILKCTGRPPQPIVLWLGNCIRVIEEEIQYLLHRVVLRIKINNPRKMFKIVLNRK